LGGGVGISSMYIVEGMGLDKKKLEDGGKKGHSIKI
jgi:hypothetical protein